MSSSGDAPRLTLDELKLRLDDIFYLDIVTGRSYERLLDGLATLPRPKQDFALHWGKVAARSDIEVGYLVIELAPAALRAMPPADAARWVIGALDEYDYKGMRGAVARLRDIEGSARPAVALRLAAVEARLAHFVHGLSGRPLSIAAAEGGAWTDTETLYLPASLTGTDALDRYRALAALLWAQARYGSFAPGLEQALAACGDAERAAAWFALVEALRLSACLARDLPGLRASLDELLAELPPQLDAARGALARADAGIADSLAQLPALMPFAPPGEAALAPVRTALALQLQAERIARDTLVLRKAVAGLMAALGKPGSGETALDVALEASSGELRIDGEIVALPPEARSAAQSLVQDLGEIPPECLTPAGPSAWTPTSREGAGPAAAVEASADAVYDEWDYRRRAYRRHWCHLFERPLPPGDADYVDAVRRSYALAIRQVRRRFEALRGEDKILKRQPDGEDIDLDALVAAIADRRGGADPDERIFARRHRAERSLAAMFLVDMSGSTKGWVNDAEREALVMLCEALETLGDAFAIWGFSGWTRTRCEVYRIKDFGERYGIDVERRIAAIEAKDYTRMGPPLRHLTRQLVRQPAKHRLLVTLSDGRPDDFGDEYRGQYGIEDTRQALVEARRAGVRSYCVTIDRHGPDYLKRMYGPAGYTVLADVRKLPLRIADIYRKLTS